MKRILIISFWNPTKQEPGKGVFIHEQVNALCNSRSDIVFLEVNILPLKNTIYRIKSQELQMFSSKKIVLNIYSLLWKLIFVNPWLTYFIIKKTLKKEFPYLKPTLIHSNVVYPCGIVGYYLAKKYRCKYIISEHWSKASKILRHSIYKKAALNTYKKSKAVLCVSNFLAENIKIASGLNNIVIVPNIIDCYTFRFIPKVHETNIDYFFTCVATWKKPKRLDLIVNSLIAFSQKSGKIIVLNVIGLGPQREEFYLANKNTNLTINWLGYLPKQEIAVILKKSDFFMHASEIETFSIVTVEALSTGTPVLASNVGAIPELVDSTNGILVENTLEAWIEGLMKLTSLPYDNQVIAQSVSGKYSSEAIVAMIEKVYDDVLSKNE
jgi:L-malate glycosyltransferase